MSPGRAGCLDGSDALMTGGASGGELAKCPDTWILCPQTLRPQTATLATLLFGGEGSPACQRTSSSQKQDY